MASYSCIAEFFSEPDSMAYLSFLCENLEGDTNALQAFLGESSTVSLLRSFPFLLTLIANLSPLPSLLCPVLPENTLLSVPDVAYAIRTLPERKQLDGYRLVSKIESTRDKLLLGFHQVCVCAHQRMFSPKL